MSAGDHDAGPAPGKKGGEAGVGRKRLGLQYSSKEVSARPVRRQGHRLAGPVSLPCPVTGWNQHWEA